MTLTFDRDSLVAFATPAPSSTALRLGEVLRDGLDGVAPQDPAAAHDRAVQLARLDTIERGYAGRAGQHGALRYASRLRSDIHHVFATYAKRLPQEWQRWLWWAHWCYENALPRDLPLLLDAIEALIAVEAQLQVDSSHANRDHIVHQLADAEVAVKLHERATDGYDDRDWERLQDSARLNAIDRKAVTRAGLCLAGMFHDVGYLRYIGASARHALATGFGIAAPLPTLDPWAVMETFAGGYLDQILSVGGRSDGLVVDVFRFGWDQSWHGPLSALVLAGAARRVQREGRASPRMSGSLQLAAAAAFLHELHPGKEQEVVAPVAIREARRRIGAYAWPALFRIVDELQCWCRPKLVPHDQPSQATLRFGARGATLDATTMAIQVDRQGDADGEVSVLRFLLGDHPARGSGSARAVFAALGISTVVEQPAVGSPATSSARTSARRPGPP